jgi:hypothetical protein
MRRLRSTLAFVHGGITRSITRPTINVGTCFHFFLRFRHLSNSGEISNFIESFCEQKP